MLLVLTLITALAEAGEAVVVSRFEPLDGASAKDALALQTALLRAVAAAPDYRALSPNDAPAIGSLAPSVFLDRCPKGEMVGCTFRIAEAMKARWAVTGTLAADRSVELQVLDIPAFSEATALDLAWDPKKPAELTGPVVAALDRVRTGMTDEPSVAEEPDEPAEPYRSDDPEQDPDALGNELDGMSHDRGRTDEAAVRQKRPRYTYRSLMRNLGDEAPWEMREMTPRQYLRWWNSGWDEVTWRALARGRKGQLLLRALGGAGTGPRSAYYQGRYAVEGSSNRLLEVYAAQEVDEGWGSSLGLAAGYGLLSWLEIEAGISREGGRFATAIHREEEGADPELEIDEDDSNGGFRAQGGLRLAPLPRWPARPLLAVGVALDRGSNVASHVALPSDALPVFAAPMMVSACLTPGVEVRLTQRFDLVVQGTFTSVLSGGESAVLQQGYGILSDTPEPGVGPSTGYTVLLGAQTRLGGSR